MKKLITPTIVVVLCTALTGIGCHLSGMSQPDLVIAVIVAAVVSGAVAYGCAFVHSRKSGKAS